MAFDCNERSVGLQGPQYTVGPFTALKGRIRRIMFVE